MKVQNIILAISLLFLCNSCSMKNEKLENKIDDDYVLVEFASKLEEDFHRINNNPTKYNENPTGHHP